MLSAAALSVFLGLASASFNGNLNYRSPSLQHPALGIDVPKVYKRTIADNYGWGKGNPFINPHINPIHPGPPAPWGPPGNADPNVDNPNVETNAEATVGQSIKPAAPSTWLPSQLNFTHGIASGDPYPHSVILWTRVSPMMANDRSNVTLSGTAPLYNHGTAAYIAASKNPVCVEWKVYSDSTLKNVEDMGTAYTTSDIDFTVKVEANGLNPFTTYWYQFNVCGSNNKSPLGRTKTTPLPNDKTANVGLAVFSCSNYPNGYFNAYGNAARKDNVDYFVHLGDYIYETGAGLLGRDPRATNPAGAIFSLYDYRTRLAQYRTDLDLLFSHQNFAWITTWDDHEVANNADKQGSSAVNNTESSFIRDGMVSVDSRKANAVRAYFEWMPIRQVDMDDNLRIWRTFSIGSLFDLIMLDTRNYDRSITDLNWNTKYIHEIADDSSRSLMGSHQENWFYRQLSRSKSRGAAWRIIGNQIVFSRVNISSWFGSPELPYNVDQWDGYMANKNRTLKHLYDNDINNNIMLSGDSHANWVSDLVWLDEEEYNPSTGAGSIGVEFAGTSVTSSGFGGTIATANRQSSTLVRDNRELQWQEGYYRGYYQLAISQAQVKAEYFGIGSVASRNGNELSLANFTVANGANRLSRPIAAPQNGVTRNATFTPNNITKNTNTGRYEYFAPNQMFLTYPRVNTTA